MKKALALLMALSMVFSLAACGETGSTSTAPSTSTTVSSEEEQVLAPVAELKSLANKEYGTDYISLYEKFGKDVTIADVIEDEETGTAYIVRDNVSYPLGLDFLSRAMVYNTAVPENSDWETEEDVYASWYRLFITRWNQLLPEIPLYSNDFYDLYNSQIKGVEEFPTNPYWSPSQALIDWTSEKSDNSIILGDATELSGKFRMAVFGAAQPGASDRAVQDMVSGLATVEPDVEGNFVWNDTVVASHEEKTNEDGTLTYTIKLNNDLKFSDGSPINAKNYLASTLVFSSPVATQAAGKDHQSGLQLVGYSEFAAYTGPGSEGEGVKKEFSGIRLIDDYTFSVTFSADYVPYFYSITYAAFKPSYLPLWLGENDIADDGNGVYLTDNFYAKSGDSYVMADHIKASAWNTDNTYPYSGMYTIEKWDSSALTVTLKRNPEFKGDYRGKKPSIEKVVVKRTVPATQLEDFKSGGIDVLANITGGDETNEALALADAKENEGKYVYTHYSRAGYGKLAFRCDFGPVQFPEVRQAIAYCMDRAKFAKDFTGGYGVVVDGPYYSSAWQHKKALSEGMLLNAYATSVDSAIQVLEDGGWVYNSDGSAYSGEGVRYKKIAASDIDERDITFQSKDGAYKTVKLESEDAYLMPLCLNWYGTTPNPVSDLLVLGFLENPNMTKAGFVIQHTLGEFNPMLDEMYQAPVTGSYNGIPMYTCFNLATGFPTAVYDQAYYFAIEPNEFDNFNSSFLKDLADAYWLA